MSDSKQPKSKKQIWALIGVGVLLAMYLVAMVLAIVAFVSGSPNARNMMVVAIAATAGVPVIIYFIMMFYRLANRKKEENASDTDKH